LSVKIVPIKVRLTKVIILLNILRERVLRLRPLRVVPRCISGLPSECSQARNDEYSSNGHHDRLDDYTLWGGSLQEQDSGSAQRHSNRDTERGNPDSILIKETTPLGSFIRVLRGFKGIDNHRCS
jgi:hypothetical protein